MKQRTITGLMLTALVAVLLWLPGWCMATAVMICVSFALHEEMKALEKAGHRLKNERIRQAGTDCSLRERRREKAAFHGGSTFLFGSLPDTPAVDRQPVKMRIECLSAWRHTDHEFPGGMIS